MGWHKYWGGKMNKYRIRILQGLFLLTSLVGITWYGMSSILISLGIYVFLEIFVGNATLHRYYGHRAFEMGSKKKIVLTWLAHHIGVGSVLGWAGHHRWHHQYSDTANDLHSPTKNGIGHILFGVWDVSIPRRMISDLLKDPALIGWHKNYFKYHFLLFVTLALVSPWALVFIYALPNLMCLFSGYIIAILPHLSGEAKNSWITEALTFGEGWHGYHHDSPGDYRFSKFDLTALAIDAFLKKNRH